MASQLPPSLEKIKHVVVLMFENRSFDHIFGDFPNVDGLFTNGIPKPECYNTANPLAPADDEHNPAAWPSPVPPHLPLGYDPNKPLQGRDFTHDFGDGMMPDLFGPIFTVNPSSSSNDPGNQNATYLSGYVAGQPTNVLQSPTPTTYPATNSGFFSTYNFCKPQGELALSYFKKGDLKALHTLADEFVLCDNWYCDMPGHTEPNRCFMHCATTGSVGIDDPDNGQNTAPTIFDLLNAAQLSWNMYSPVQKHKDELVLGQLDTRFLNENVANYPGVPLTQFALDCQNGTLPVYSFIMCWLPFTDPWSDTSMHPGSVIQPGENLLAAVYNTLRNSPHWEDTLLVVNFDENGGIYDHKFPPTTQRPDPLAHVTKQNIQGCCGNKWYLESQFDFSLLGLRIPALLISPWLKPEIDSTPYQNTSVLRFLIDLINRLSPSPPQPYLTQRDANAPSLEQVFAKYGSETMRDCPTHLETTKTMPGPYGNIYELPYGDGKLDQAISLTQAMLDAAPVSYIQELVNIYLRRLPGHPDSGAKITRAFQTNAEVLAYTKERLQASKM